MTLTPLAEKFILHWGEMGTQWGVNRTVAQIHALLFIAARPMAADEICETLINTVKTTHPSKTIVM